MLRFWFILPMLMTVSNGLAPGTKCAPGRFDCGNGRCILRRYLCDGVNTCGGNQDEQNCGVCSPDAFRCDGNRCVSNTSRCDGHRHCNDGTDEEGCGVIDPASLFTCNDGGKRRAETYCDGEHNCFDTSDELNCTYCQRGAVLCDGLCHSPDGICDGVYQCTNGIDEANCNKTEIFVSNFRVKCRKDQFDCGTNQCLDMKYRCDGTNNCNNAADEVGCDVCAPNAFRCDGKCQRSVWRCDGHNYCRDGKDEENCPDINPIYLFICNDGTTRQNATRCDGVFSCPNQEDEANCRPEMCQEGAFYCAGGCRHPSSLCNGVRECPDGEDEIHCPGFESDVDLARTCGRAGTGPAALVVNGQKAELGAFPWHAGIYRLKNEQNCDDYEYICGASLITKDVLVTAAHCFYKSAQKLDAKYFAVAVGKIYSGWDADEVGEFHKSKVKSIHIYPVYRGLKRKYADDIALVVMEKPAILGKHVATVCLDPTINLNYRDLIHVVGWGNGSNALQELESVRLPYKPFESCVDELESNPSEISFLTYDKFCSPLQNWTFRAPGLAQGDSGGGAVVRRGGSWTLVGIVSISLSQGRVFGFTNVSHHSQWISRNLATNFKFVRN